MSCYCRGQAVCHNCEQHTCTDCRCNDIEQTKEADK